MPRRSKKDILKDKLQDEVSNNTENQIVDNIEQTEELIFETPKKSKTSKSSIEQDVVQLESKENKRVKVLQKIRFSFNNSFNVLFLIFIVYFALTALINYKSILTGYERIFLNDFKDLFYWLRFTLGATAIVYFCFFVVGIDLKKEIQDDNKSAVIFAVGLIAITYFFGQRLFN